MTLTQRVDFKTRQRRQIRNLGDRSKRNICLKIKFTAFPLPPPPRAFSSNFSKSMMKNNIRRKNYLHPWCFINKLVFAQEKLIYLSPHCNIFFWGGGEVGGALGRQLPLAVTQDVTGARNFVMRSQI